MSQKLLLSDEWYQSLAGIVSEIGEDQFCSSFASVCEGLTGYDSTVVAGLRARRKTSVSVQQSQCSG